MVIIIITNIYLYKMLFDTFIWLNIFVNTSNSNTQENKVQNYFGPTNMSIITIFGDLFVLKNTFGYFSF